VVQERVQRAFAPTTLDELLLPCEQGRLRPRPPVCHPRCQRLLVAARRVRLSAALEGVETDGCRLLPPHRCLHEPASCPTAEVLRHNLLRGSLRSPQLPT